MDTKSGGAPPVWWVKHTAQTL